MYETSDGSLFESVDEATTYEEICDTVSEIQELLQIPEDSVIEYRWKKYRRGKDYIQHSEITVTGIQKKLFDIFQNRIGLYDFKDYTFKEAKEYSWQKVLQEMDRTLDQCEPKPFTPLMPLIEQMLRIDDQYREWYKEEYTHEHFTGIEHPN